VLIQTPGETEAAAQIYTPVAGKCCVLFHVDQSGMQRKVATSCRQKLLARSLHSEIRHRQLAHQLPETVALTNLVTDEKRH